MSCFYLVSFPVLLKVCTLKYLGMQRCVPLLPVTASQMLPFSPENKTCMSFNHISFTFVVLSSLQLTLSSLHAPVFYVFKIFLQDGWIICSACDIEGLTLFVVIVPVFLSFSLILIISVWFEVLPTVKFKSYRCPRNSISKTNILYC